MKNKEFNIIISNSDYTITASGTEKVIRNLVNTLNDNNISVVQIYKIKKIEYLGVYIDNKFYGVYNKKNIKNLISYFINKGYKCNGIILEHIIGFETSFIKNLILELKINVVIAIHDFYYICNTFDFLKNHKNFCGITKPTKEKCKDCYNYPKVLEHQKEIKELFNQCDKYIKKIVFPSEFCLNEWIKIYPKLKTKAVVREHQIEQGNYKNNKNNKKLRLAYIGKKSIHKGYNTWKKIISNRIIQNNYELYYFGTNIDKNSNIKEIYTSNAVKDDEMVQQLRKNNIDVVLLLSTIPETYSFTYYEATASNSLIITTIASGNIANMCIKRGNGIVLNDEKELIEYLESKNNYKNILLHKNSLISPLSLTPNQQYDVFEVDSVKKTNIKPKNRNILILKYLYLIVRRIKINEKNRNNNS